MIAEKLQQFGLSQKEARVYTALQRLGTSVVSEIAKKSGVNRSTAYVLLDALAKRGLVSTSEQNGIRVFSPAPAERFVQLAESSLAKWSSLAALSRELLGEFKRQSKARPTKPVVQLFEGTEGIKTVYEMMLIQRERVRSYSALSVMEEALPRFFSAYRARQEAKGIHTRVIVPNTPQNRETIASDIREYCEYFLVPPDDYASDFLISGNRVAFVSFAEPSALVIEDAPFATLQKSLFDALLTQAHRSNVKSPPVNMKPKRRQPSLIKATKRFFSV